MLRISTCQLSLLIKWLWRALFTVFHYSTSLDLIIVTIKQNIAITNFMALKDSFISLLMKTRATFKCKYFTRILQLNLWLERCTQKYKWKEILLRFELNEHRFQMNKNVTHSLLILASIKIKWITFMYKFGLISLIYMGSTYLCFTTIDCNLDKNCKLLALNNFTNK